MKNRPEVFFTVIIFFSSFALAENCENVIALSKIRSTVVQGTEAVEQHASNFCNEYGRSSGSSQNKSYGASYEFLSASFGSSGASVEEVASKYCASDNVYSASRDAYRQYIESISPGAYGAYEQCVEMSNQSIRFNVDPGSVLPTEFTISASFVSNESLRNKAELTYSHSVDVTCAWSEPTGPKKVLETGSTVFLNCNRPHQDVRSYVTIVDRMSGGNMPLTLPWQAYNEEGVPVSALNELEREIDRLSSDIIVANTRASDNLSSIENISNSPAVAIYKCPNGTNGWSRGGDWASYGCQGQISTQAQCTNIEFPHVQNRQCEYLGTIRLF